MKYVWEEFLHEGSLLRGVRRIIVAFIRLIQVSILKPD